MTVSSFFLIIFDNRGTRAIIHVFLYERRSVGKAESLCLFAGGHILNGNDVFRDLVLADEDHIWNAELIGSSFLP